MIFNFFSELPFKNYQVIIIGSGPAGISLALKLERKKISSLILEAGEEDYSETSQENYQSNVIGDSISDLRYSRLRQLGGTSGHWGGWCKPIEDWNLTNWPININDINSYSTEASDILNIKPKFDKTKINNHFNQIEFQYSDVRFAEKYKDYLQKSKLIDVCLNTQISHFIGANQIFKEAKIISKKKIFFIKSKFFVLACGGIENSRILLWTKEKNNNLINPNLPIGKYWMTHPWFLGGVGFLKKKKIKDLLQDEFLKYDGPIHFASSQRLIEQEQILSGAVYMNADEDNKLHKEIIKNFLCVSPSYGKKIARMLFNKDLKCGNIFLNMEESPDKNNKIVLDQYVKDNNEIPISNIHYKKSKKTILSAKTILEKLASLFIEKNLGRIAVKDNIASLDGYENLGVHHHMGGTRMGKNKEKSVVDHNLKLHDSNNLYVTGSSVFTTSGYANPTYTIVKLSLKLGDEITQRIINNI
jgi:hypothetical protein